MRRIVLVVALSSVAQIVAAQAPATGRIEGSVTDSVHAMPLADATVSLARLDAQRDSTLVAATAEDGRFRFEHVMAGQYALSFSSAFLDSLEFGGLPTALAVRGGEIARVDLAVPSGATLRAIACPGMALSRGTGALVGVVTDADSERPLGGAQVAAMWTELTFDARMRRVSTVEHSGGVVTDSLGQYRLCGVPTESWLLVQVQHRDRLGAAFQLLVSESSGVTMQHLSFSESGTRPLSALRAAQGDAAQLAPLSGTAALDGTIRTSRGRPVADAQVRVVSTSPVTRTDAQGRFALTGLPTGTQELEIRELGSQVQRQPVELRDGRTTRSEIQLRNVVALDPVRTVSTRARYERFEINRRTSLNGIRRTSSGGTCSR